MHRGQRQTTIWFFYLFCTFVGIVNKAHFEFYFEKVRFLVFSRGPYLQQQHHVSLGQLLAVQRARAQTHHRHVAHGGMSVGDAGYDLETETRGRDKLWTFTHSTGHQTNTFVSQQLIA